MRPNGDTRRIRSGAAPISAVPFLDRERESRRIEDALRKRESLVISGPAGIGKTFLFQSVMKRLRGGFSSPFLYLPTFKDLQDLLRKLLQAVYEAKNPSLRKELHAHGFTGRSFDTWLKSLSSSRLKGTLYRAVESSEYCVVLDHVPPLTRPIAKVIKELFWMRNTPVYLLMRDDWEYGIVQLIHFFYWSEHQWLSLAPLPAQFAHELLEHCIASLGLGRFDLEDFREEVLELSKCVPGAIAQMCALAADPRYQYGSRIKTKLVHIDYLMSRQHLKPFEQNEGSEFGAYGNGRA
jgi:hypothetical protein